MTQWPKFVLAALYALVLLATPFLSYDSKARTLISVTKLIVKHKPFSRFVAGCAAWLLFLVVQSIQADHTVLLSYI